MTWPGCWSEQGSSSKRDFPHIARFPRRESTYGWSVHGVTFLKRSRPVLLLITTVLLSACGPSAGHRETTESLASRLEHLSVEQMSALGSHRCETLLSMATRSKHRSQVIREQYDLQWDGWDRYRYRVQKGEFAVMDVTVWGGRAYQREFGGRIRVRDDPAEVNYYLRQTWNQWPGATEAFKPVLVYEQEGSGTFEGREVEKYHIALRRQIDPNPRARNRLRQAVEHDKAEGLMWIDRATGVPLFIDFTGIYRVVRFSRGPGGRKEETRHTLEFKLRRHDFGARQVTESPPLARSQ